MTTPSAEENDTTEESATGMIVLVIGLWITLLCGTCWMILGGGLPLY